MEAVLVNTCVRYEFGSMADGTTQPAGLSYERRLDADGRWALSEGSRYFDGTSEVHATLYVQSKYHELWQATTSGGRRYIRLWPSKSLLEEIHSIDELIELLPDDTRLLKQMRDDGVTLDPGVQTPEKYVALVTADPEVARKYDMHEQSEFWSDGGT